MRVEATMLIDCSSGSTRVTVSAEVPDEGDSELDVNLYDSMLKALRLMAVAARSEQQVISIGAAA